MSDAKNNTYLPAIGAALKPERIIFLDCETKAAALEHIVDCLSKSSEVTDKSELSKGIFHRESLMSTGIGLGIGVPHVRLASVKKTVMAVGICRKPLADYESIDGEPVRLLFMITTGEKQQHEYLALLSSLSKRCKDNSFRESLLNASSTQEAHELLFREK